MRRLEPPDKKIADLWKEHFGFSEECATLAESTWEAIALRVAILFRKIFGRYPTTILPAKADSAKREKGRLDLYS